MLRLVSKGITIERLFVSRCFVKVLEKAANFMPQVNSIWFTGNSPIHSWVLRDFWGQGKMMTFVKHATHLHRWPRDFWTLYCVCQTWTGLIWQRTVLLFDFLPSNTMAGEHGKELFYLQKSIWEENIDYHAVCLLLVNEPTIFVQTHSTMWHPTIQMYSGTGHSSSWILKLVFDVDVGTVSYLLHIYTYIYAYICIYGIWFNWVGSSWVVGKSQSESKCVIGASWHINQWT